MFFTYQIFVSCIFSESTYYRVLHLEIFSLLSKNIGFKYNIIFQLSERISEFFFKHKRPPEQHVLKFALLNSVRDILKGILSTRSIGMKLNFDF